MIGCESHFWQQQDIVCPLLPKQFYHSGRCVREQLFAVCVKQLQTAGAGVTSYQAEVPRD